jgi:hypothetical protein
MLQKGFHFQHLPQVDGRRLRVISEHKSDHVADPDSRCVVVADVPEVVATCPFEANVQHSMQHALLAVDLKSNQLAVMSSIYHTEVE